MLTYLDSRANILLDGANGSGKTTFVRDCLETFGLESPLIYVDAVEYYNEKLMCIVISHQIVSALQRLAKELGLPRSVAKRLAFKIQKNYPSLLQGMQ